MAGLIFKNIVKPLSDGAGFDKFNLEIDDGEFVALVGPNGCGRAELIRMAEGYGGAFEGDVFAGERKVSHFDHGVSGTSLINDVPLIGTPRREITKLLKIKRVPESEIEERIKAAALENGAAECLDTRYSKLSPEMRLRAGMTRAAALRAGVVLLVDPFDEMNSRTAARMRLAIMEFYRRTKAAFVMSTHSGNVAMALATRVVVLDRGRIRQSDTPQNIYDYPADRFVAEYFGSSLINIFPASFMRDENETYAVFGLNRILVPAGKLSKLTDKKYLSCGVLMGVRPENLHYEQAFISMTPESAVEARIGHIELMGSDTFLHIALDGVPGDVIARVDPRCIAFPGDSITLAIDSNRLHFFDKDTEYSVMSRL